MVNHTTSQRGFGNYFQPTLVVVEVRHGESQEEAWRRYLAEHPRSAQARIKIFHFPKPTP
uniref:Uncharacterized protein n=1 Tax=Desulfobacca acetoxidans TaxID=60893 RepID=A0A7C3ZAX8_9BACT